MGVAASIEKLTSSKILRTLENNLVAKKICTEDVGADIKKAGDTVYFVGLADPTVKTYSGSITYESLKDASLSLLIDQEKYVAFEIKDVDKFRSKIDLKGGQVERGGYKLRDVADAYVFGLYAGAGNTVTQASCTSANVLSTVSNIAKILEKNNVPEGQRWMVIPPWFKQKMILAGIKFQINNGVEGEKGGLSYADYLGIDIYSSNNIYTTGSIGTENSKILAGSFNSIVYADQLLKTKYRELEGKFSEGYAALHVYGAKVLKPAELVLLNATEAAESTI